MNGELAESGGRPRVPLGRRIAFLRVQLAAVERERVLGHYSLDTGLRVAAMHSLLDRLEAEQAMQAPD